MGTSRVITMKLDDNDCVVFFFRRWEELLTKPDVSTWYAHLMILVEWYSRSYVEKLLSDYWVLDVNWPSVIVAVEKMVVISNANGPWSRTPRILTVLVPRTELRMCQKARLLWRAIKTNDPRPWQQIPNLDLPAKIFSGREQGERMAYENYCIFKVFRSCLCIRRWNGVNSMGSVQKELIMRLIKRILRNVI